MLQTFVQNENQRIAKINRNSSIFRERKTETEPFASFRYVSICSGEIPFFRLLTRSVHLAPQYISMLQYKDITYNFNIKIWFVKFNVCGES